MNSGNTASLMELFDNISDLLFILDLEGNIIEINKTVSDVLGYSSHELKGKSVLLVHPPDSREKAGQVVQKMLAGEEKSCELPLLSKNNLRIPVETHVAFGKWGGADVIIGLSRNLTELKRSREKFKQVFDVNSQIMAISSLDNGVFIDVNEKFIEVLGYSREEVIGKFSRDLHLFNDYNNRAYAMELFRRNGFLKNYEVEIRKKNGEVLTVLFFLEKINIQGTEYLLTSAIDITQRKKIEAKLEYFLLQQKLLAEISQELITAGKFEEKADRVVRLLGEHIGCSRVYVFENDNVNDECSKTYEWCNTGILPQINELQKVPYTIIPSWKKILLEAGRVHSENINELPEDIQAVLQPQGIKSILVYPIYAEEKFFGFMGFDECVRNKVWSEDEVELLLTATNILASAYERKIILSRLQESELQLKLALSGAEEGMWDWNVATGDVYFSDLWCSMLGYSREDIETNVKSWEKLVHPDDMSAVAEELEKHLKGETKYYEAIHRVKTKSGAWKWIRDHGMVVERNEKGEPVRALGTHIDFTAQKEIEDKLKELNAAKDKFFSIISHDLRNPFVVLLGYSNYLKDDYNSLSDDERKFSINAIYEASKNTYTLLEDLLAWAKAQRDGIVIFPELQPVFNAAEEAVFSIKDAAIKKDIQIINNVPSELDAYFDLNTIITVIRNLVSNAVKFTNPGGRIEIEAAPLLHNVQITITDDGIGIKEDAVKRLFKIDSQYTTEGTMNEKGTGLGLILCKEFVEKNNGSISIESEYGKGTRVNILLPSKSE